MYFGKINEMNYIFRKKSINNVICCILHFNSDLDSKQSQGCNRVQSTKNINQKAKVQRSVLQECDRNSAQTCTLSSILAVL